MAKRDPPSAALPLGPELPAPRETAVDGASLRLRFQWECPAEMDCDALAFLRGPDGTALDGWRAEDIFARYGLKRWRE